MQARWDLTTYESNILGVVLPMYLPIQNTGGVIVALNYQKRDCLSLEANLFRARLIHFL